MMTTQDWLELLEATPLPGVWYVDRLGKIRSAQGRCPLCAVASQLAAPEAKPSVDHWHVGWTYALRAAFPDENVSNASPIADAADGKPLVNDTLRIRERLLRHLNLKES